MKRNAHTHLLLLLTWATTPAENLIQSMLITKHRLEVKICNTLEKNYFRQMFFAEYADDAVNLKQLPLSIVLIPFVASVITAVWASDQTFYIDCLDKDFAESLECIKPVMQRLYPSLAWSGKLIPKELVEHQVETYQSHGRAAVLFSAGVDTTCTSLRNNHLQQLLITAWGSDVSPYDTTMWYGLHEICSTFAQTFGHEHTYVRSNFSGIFGQKLYDLTPEIPRWWKYTSMGLSYCGLVAPILVVKGYTKLLVGATYTPQFPCKFGSLPCIDEQIRYAGISVLHDSFELNRQEKIQLIAQRLQECGTQIFLKPCWKGNPDGKNCQMCIGKCLQTMNALLIEGLDPRAYGFTLSDEDIILRTWQYLCNKRTVFGKGSIDRWKTMQQRIRQVLSEASIPYAPKIRAYLVWLASFDLERLKK